MLIATAAAAVLVPMGSTLSAMQIATVAAAVVPMRSTLSVQ